MARPKTRTAVLDGAELGVIKGSFPTCTYAYAQLRLADAVTYPSFQRVWQGKPVTPREVGSVRAGWTEWTLRTIQVLRESQKAPVDEMYRSGEGSDPAPFAEVAAA